MYCFQLGREFKLSIAEILSVFPNAKIVFLDKKNLILDNVSREEILEKADHLGGTIKISEIIDESILDIARKTDRKFQYGISLFGKDGLKQLLMDTKKQLKSADISSRFVNSNFENLKSSQIIFEKLVEKGTDFSVIFTKDQQYLGKTIWVQDIEAYSKRDYGKSRDMEIGMLPPKLSQIMINLSGGKTIYDPFCGLGTILIESQHMGNEEVYGSDFNQDMVDASMRNIGSKNIFLFDARDMDENKVFENDIDAIVTEGFLGEIMTKRNISHERIDIQRKNLSKLYEKFFSGLQSVGFKGNIVISFPFWEIPPSHISPSQGRGKMKGKYFYFVEIYEILEKYCEIQALFPTGIDVHPTKSGSLLYKRDTQLVGREIFKLKIR